ncbi:MAG: T9SS type A sorting domain-containing protein [Bacteroidales bacterium]|nr:T9SS type A sorting domain-containing protein [Bacteroidales bacterium]
MDEVHNGYQINLTSGSLATGSSITKNAIGCKRTGVEVNIGNPGITNALLVDDNTIGIGEDEVIAPGIGVWVNSTAGTTVAQHINITNNTAIDLYKGESGITVSNAKGVYVAGNTIVLHSPILKRRTGIHLEYGEGNTVGCTNNISGPSGSFLGKSYGIFVEGSKGNLITSNNTSGTNQGIHIDLPSVSAENIRCNVMSGHKIGLSYTKTANSGWQTNKGNQWTGTWSGGNVGARHLGPTDIFVSQSRYRASTSATTTSGNQWPPPSGVDLAPATGVTDPWFWAGSLVNCGTITACDVFATQSVDGLDSAIATVTFDFDEGEEVVNWMMRQYLYQRLLQDTSLMSGNSLMQSFKTSYDADPVGLLYASGMRTKGLFEPTTLQNDTLTAGFESIQAALEDIADLTEQVNDSTYIAIRDSLLQIKYAKLAYTDSINAVLENLWGRLFTNLATGADTIISSNEAITTVGDYDANEQTLYDLFLKTAAKGENLDLSQIALLCDMANQCPLEGGPATFWARAWYATETGIRINTEACEPTEERERDEEGTDIQHVEKNWIAVSPNPAAGTFEIRYQCTEEMSAGSVSITDSFGRALATFAIGNEPNGNLSVNTLDLPSGIYFVRLQATGRTLAVHKLVVNK